MERRELLRNFAIAGIAGTADLASGAPGPAVVGSNHLNVGDFGAKGDGIQDDTSAFQKAMDECGRRGGGVVEAPAGNYMIKGHLVVPEAVALEGNWQAPATSEGAAPHSGTILLAVEGAGKPEGTPFIRLHTNSTLKGITIFYPLQTVTNPPVAYPWTVATAEGGASNASIIDVFMVNPFQAVDFGSYPSGRHYIRGLYAQALYRGIYVDRCQDVGRIENVHLWPFWKATFTDPLAQFTHAHGEGFIFGRADWELMVDCFVLNHNAGFRFTRHAPAGICRTAADPEISKGFVTSNVLLTGGGTDNCYRGVLVEDCQIHVGVSFVNCQIFGDLEVEPTNSGMVKFTSCALLGGLHGTNGSGIARIAAGRSRISFSNCHFYSLIEHRNMPLIHVLSGRVGIVNCAFINNEKMIGPAPWNPEHIVLEPDVISAVITSNEFYAPQRIVNKSRGQIVIGDNVSQTETG